ncbi:MAG: coproporphyrinogen III oxidase, partial [Bacteroidales bacterium]|nr:coproporphyrinogen III oxidase [Bacteroidales bacterium]
LVRETPDEVMLKMYRYMLLQMSSKGYEAYEISNFALSGFRSKHNSAYWDLTPYLGAGPSAHSYDGSSRQWNISNLMRYMEGVEKEMLAFERELLSERDSYNDYVMVRLRTRAGIGYSEIVERFGPEMLYWCKSQAERYIQTGHLQLTAKGIQLTLEGIEISNSIIADLMKTD